MAKFALFSNILIFPDKTKYIILPHLLSTLIDLKKFFFRLYCCLKKTKEGYNKTFDFSKIMKPEMMKAWTQLIHLGDSTTCIQSCPNSHPYRQQGDCMGIFSIPGQHRVVLRLLKRLEYVILSFWESVFVHDLPADLLATWFTVWNTKSYWYDHIFQFDKVVLDCALRLLEKAKLNMPTRGDPVKIVRTMSAIVSHFLNDLW